MHFHGWGLFLSERRWLLASSARNDQKCRTLNERKVEENPFWREHASETMAKRCPLDDDECPYWYDEDYIF